MRLEIETPSGRCVRVLSREFPAGENKQLNLWFNTDPKEYREAQEARMRKITGAQ